MSNLKKEATTSSYCADTGHKAVNDSKYLLSLPVKMRQRLGQVKMVVDNIKMCCGLVAGLPAIGTAAGRIKKILRVVCSGVSRAEKAVKKVTENKSYNTVCKKLKSVRRKTGKAKRKVRKAKRDAEKAEKNLLRQKARRII